MGYYYAQNKYWGIKKKMVNIGNIFRYTVGSGSIGSNKWRNARNNADSTINLPNSHNNNHNNIMPMEVKIAIILGKFIILPIVIIDAIIAILGQLQIKLPEWAAVSPIYRDCFMIIGILFMTVRLLLLLEVLWSKHLDNIDKKNKSNDKSPK